MAILALKMLKVVLFVILFLLAVIFVHTYPYPMPESQLKYWFAVSEFLGIANPEDIYFPTMWVIDFIVAVIAYSLIMKLWRKVKNNNQE
ncbi:hypothetical protein JMY81_07170 [Brenneria goodwinii]|uniref:hypothetical protein n=1 Tax=Brenneria goodwinii TaxID=1109412 RepID=UPI000EF1D75C|nr:hypothetical protein [Brenneria goodwinii]MCG8155785.1 hypothetical protein [Brenneria goodwinii]MCG8160617.1 hypothetical protein [Brenneria goodwinii]MCG8166945.1 hypothetical protein [Brenneria goodwinii]MCG8172614.1 hypothetical protein [Brenneria goodwinii]MCG8177322.1 hypothetical protein [Brenneria goodwinii]